MNYVKEELALAFLAVQGVQEKDVVHAALTTTLVDGKIIHSLEWIPKEPIEKFVFHGTILDLNDGK